MARPLTYTWVAPSTTDICTLQTLGGAGSLAINGTSAVKGSVHWSQVARTVSLASANNLGAVNFTIVGKCAGQTVSATIAGPNADTVYTVALFDTITSVSTSAAAAAVSVGSGTTGRTNWFLSNYDGTVLGLDIQSIIANTITYSFVTTLDDVTQTLAPALFRPVAGMALNTNASALVTYMGVGRWSAIHIDSSTNGSLTATFLKAGIN